MVMWVCEASEVNNLTVLAVGPNGRDNVLRGLYSNKDKDKIASSGSDPPKGSDNKILFAGLLQKSCVFGLQVKGSSSYSVLFSATTVFISTYIHRHAVQQQQQQHHHQQQQQQHPIARRDHPISKSFDNLRYFENKKDVLGRGYTSS